VIKIILKTKQRKRLKTNQNTFFLMLLGINNRFQLIIIEMRKIKVKTKRKLNNKKKTIKTTTTNIFFNLNLK
jgi:hypothetical protein